MSFSLDLSKFAEKAGKAAEQGVRKVCLDLSTGVIKDTAVRSGRARGNWQPTLDAPASGTLETLDKTGDETIAKAAAVAAIAPGRIFYLVNNLPYIVPLEYGLSQQSPAGMVRINLERVKRDLA